MIKSENIILYIYKNIALFNRVDGNYSIFVDNKNNEYKVVNSRLRELDKCIEKHEKISVRKYSKGNIFDNMVQAIPSYKEKEEN